MTDYISMLIDPEASNDEILRSFYLHPLSREQKQSFEGNQLALAAGHLFRILKETSTEHILDIIEEHKNEIQEITTGSVPQFSELQDADKVPNIVLSNPDCKYKLIGYFFNKDAEDYSQQKYGENHYKLSAQLGLCEFVEKTATENGTAVSFLGFAYKDLPKSERDAIRPKLCLQVPFIQHILIEARHGRIDAMGELKSMFTTSTAVRRRSSVQQMLKAIEGTLQEDKDILKNIDWGYKNK